MCYGLRTTDYCDVNRQKPSPEELTGPRPQRADARRAHQGFAGRGALAGRPQSVRSAEGARPEGRHEEAEEGQGRREDGRRGGRGRRRRPRREEEVTAILASPSEGAGQSARPLPFYQPRRDFL